jgi:hypothetical protein
LRLRAFLGLFFSTTKTKGIAGATLTRPQSIPGQTKGASASTQSNCDAPHGNAAARKQKRRMAALRASWM